jgi:tRNA G46 methylase TrmB
MTAFRHGGGVPQAACDARSFESMERFTAGWFNHALLQEWIPALPDVRGRLERGAEVADVGCGRGRALVRLAEAFPNSRFVGDDVFSPNVEAA